MSCCGVVVSSRTIIKTWRNDAKYTHRTENGGFYGGYKVDGPRWNRFSFPSVCFKIASKFTCIIMEWEKEKQKERNYQPELWLSRALKNTIFFRFILHGKQYIPFINSYQSNDYIESNGRNEIVCMHLCTFFCFFVDYTQQRKNNNNDGKWNKNQDENKNQKKKWFSLSPEWVSVCSRAITNVYMWKRSTHSSINEASKWILFFNCKFK